jgi:peptidoglycan/xylan/chitin deacetylase (PgdA/CDA1 family)
MYLSIWLGIVMSTSNTGCTSLSKIVGKEEIAAPSEVRRATIVSDTTTAGSIMNPAANLPNVPPAGVGMRYSSVKTTEKVVAMTFDDGPHRTITPQLLDYLRSKGIRCTFFVVGPNVMAYPDIIRTAVADGHEIANHTWNHPILTSCSDAKIRSELQRTEDAIIKVAGVRPRLVRPPGGGINKRIEAMIYQEFGYTDILWSVDPQDWRRPGIQTVTNRLVAGAHPGAIMLAHDIHPPTLPAVKAMFEQMLAQGYRFVTVSQLLNLEKKTMPLGQVIGTEPVSTGKTESTTTGKSKKGTS